MVLILYWSLIQRIFHQRMKKQKFCFQGEKNRECNKKNTAKKRADKRDKKRKNKDIDGQRSKVINGVVEGEWY